MKFLIRIAFIALFSAQAYSQDQNTENVSTISLELIADSLTSPVTLAEVPGNRQ